MAKRPSKNWISNEVFKYLHSIFENRVMVTKKNHFFLIYQPDKGYWRLDIDNNIVTSLVVDFLYTHSFRFVDTNDEFELVQLNIDDYKIGLVHSHFCLFDLLTDAKRDVATFVNNYRTFMVGYNLTKLSDMPSHSYEMTAPGQFYDEDKTQNKEYILINMANGVLRIDKRTHEMLLMDGHDKDHHFKNRIDIEYDMTRECPTWIEFLRSVVEDERDIEIIRIYMAYCLLAHDFKWETALYIFGNGANGKGTLLRAFVELFSDPTWTSISALNNRFGAMGLIEKNFWWANEQDGDAINTEFLKSIISGEPREVDIKHKDQQTHMFNMKMIVTANELPLLKKYADKRRFYVIRFPHKFEGADKDVDLDEKLMNELPGLLNWIVDAIPIYLKKKAQLSSGIAVRYENNYNELADPFKIFLESYITETGNDDDQLTTREITRAYNAFADKNKHEWMTTTATGRRVNAMYNHITKATLYVDEIVTEDGKLETVQSRQRGFKGLSMDVQMIYEMRPRWDTRQYDIDNANKNLFSISGNGSTPNITRLELTKMIWTELHEAKNIEYIYDLCNEYGYTTRETEQILRHLESEGRIMINGDDLWEAVI